MEGETSLSPYIKKEWRVHEVEQQEVYLSTYDMSYHDLKYWCNGTCF